ncbi:TonB-dependent receptor [Alistipes sp. OttesenSCG-928-B03]|nr:TonB-dependent receptor [Alistipes sp. OttesenSCG-928-B03]
MVYSARGGLSARKVCGNRNNPFKTNWSVGAGWNINREKFAEGWDMIDMLKVRASYGTAGNQKEDLLTSSVYKYHSGSNWFGQSSYLYDVANPDIAWVTVKKLSIGFDLMLARNRLNLVVDLYRNLSDPLAIKIPHPSSTGLTRYPMSLGHMTSKGLEFKVNYRIINRIEIPFILAVRINGAMTDQRYGGINNIELLNPTLGTSPTVDELMLMYKNGGDPDAMYAVRSLGIDPATGRELLFRYHFAIAHLLDEGVYTEYHLVGFVPYSGEVFPHHFFLCFVVPLAGECQQLHGVGILAAVERFRRKIVVTRKHFDRTHRQFLAIEVAVC